MTTDLKGLTMNSELVRTFGGLVPGSRIETYDHIGGAQALRIHLPNGYTVSAIPEYGPDPTAEYGIGPVPGRVELALLDERPDGDDFITDVPGFEDTVIRYLTVDAAVDITNQVAALPARP